ncbi:hypothetical protein ABZW38_32820 [Streptomyces bacillaris]|uniref:hypothetical protein n=1 Tax=Streptomyces bacillaris TaxID=68179 RepID=UPI00345F8680
MAAVLGAVVGSVATGGAAFVTSAGAARLQRRKERRESCLSLMEEALGVLHLTEDVMFHATEARAEGRTPDYSQFEARTLESRRRVEKCCDILVLSGPRRVKGACDVLTEAVGQVYSAVKHGDEARLAGAVGGLLQGMDVLRQRASGI